MTAPTLEQQFDTIFQGKLAEEFQRCTICGQSDCRCDEDTEALMEREREECE